MVNYRLLLTTDGYGKYSYLMVKIFGLKGAVYFEELIKQSIEQRIERILSDVKEGDKKFDR